MNRTQYGVKFPYVTSNSWIEIVDSRGHRVAQKSIELNNELRVNYY